MKLHIYALKNIKGDFFNAPIVNNMSREDINAQNVRFCMIEKEKAKAAHMDESALYYLGEYDDNRGIIEIAGEPVFVDDYAKYFLNGN